LKGEEKGKREREGREGVQSRQTHRRVKAGGEKRNRWERERREEEEEGGGKTEARLWPLVPASAVTAQPTATLTP
jgi:hypothetical protein